MKRLLDTLHIDGFILAILAAVLVASVFPAQGAVIPVLNWVVKAAIALLFFFYGARMHPREALDGLKHWRLHALILSFTFIVFPLIGLALVVLRPHILSPELYSGVLFLCLVPSTVQSSIAFTSIARGNVPGAIVSASASNLLGVFITPLLVVLVMTQASAVSFQASSALALVVQLLLPFILGQLARPRIGRWMERHAKPTKLVDRSSIILVVYAAFSEGVREHIWSTVGVGQILVLIGLSVALVAFLLWLTRFAGQRLGFSAPDVISIQFCGTKKSLATGVPMAAVLFVGQPLGMLVLPLMIFHQVQLMMCSWLATRYSKRPVTAVDGP